MSDSRIQISIDQHWSLEIASENQKEGGIQTRGDEILLWEDESYIFRWNIPSEVRCEWTNNPILKPSRLDARYGMIDTTNISGKISIRLQLWQNHRSKEIVLTFIIQSVKLSPEQQQWMLRDLINYDLSLILNPSGQSQIPLIKKGHSQTTKLWIYLFLRRWYRSGDFHESFESIIRYPSQQNKFQFGRSYGRLPIEKWFQSPHMWQGIPEEHPLSKTLRILPESLLSNLQSEDFETIWNRWAVGILQILRNVLHEMTINDDESIQIKNEIQFYLNQPIFKGIAPLYIRPRHLNGIHTKNGYRQLFDFWDKVSQCQYQDDGTDEIEKRSQDQLYELWVLICFIKGLDVYLERVPAKDSTSATRGAYFDWMGRDYRIRLWYNRTFSKESPFGSWSTTLRPDFTISYWSPKITYEQAVHEGAIQHLHFDAKYRRDHSGEVLRDDLHKMHTYRDAIIHSVGSYVIYPNHSEVSSEPILYHSQDMLKGVGAFPISPMENEEDLPIQLILDFLKSLNLI
jgi:hypothetical protein